MQSVPFAESSITHITLIKQSTWSAISKVYVMALVSIWSAVSYKSHVPPTVTRIRHIERSRTEHCLLLQPDYRCISAALIGETDKKVNAAHHGSYLFPKADRGHVVWLFHNKPSCFRKTSVMPLPEVYNAEGYEKCSSGGSHQRDMTSYESDQAETGSCGRQLKELDSYFTKLQYNIDEQVRSCGNGSDAKEYHLESSSQLEGQQRKVGMASDPCKRKTTLDSLENYFGELNAVQYSRKGTLPPLDTENSEGYPVQKFNPVGGGHEDMMVVERMDDEASNMYGYENIKGLQTDDKASDLYLINLLVAINIAVFLFEVASPIRNSEVENLSLPLLYGAKINKLILIGEWWRLLTPMFLHSGFLHVALSSWVLLTFGPQVCRGYGPFTFLLIYVLGGICGNLTSFLHTPEITVCGTGPVFAIIGAWLVYQIQNKHVVAKEMSESMFWKAVTATALSFLLSYFGRIDDWTHVGAAFSGIIFGYLTCPSLQLLDNALSSKDGRKQEGITLVQHQADPCKSLLVFAISMLVLGCLVFLYGPQLELLEMEEYV